MDVLMIKDKQTGELFKVSPAANTIWVTARDGTRIRLHPTFIRMMVGRGNDFDAHTLIGMRPMLRI